MAGSIIPGLDKILGEATRGTNLLSALIPAIIMIVLLIIGALIALTIYIHLRKGPKALMVEAYDPVKKEKTLLKVIELVPGIHATPDGKYIAIIPMDAYPVTLRTSKGSYKVVPAVKIGQLVYGYDPLKAFYIHLTNTGEKIPINKVSDLILYLYNTRRVKPLRLSPNVEMLVHYDGTELADFIADSIGRAGEESIVSISGMTGKRREFEAYVKTLIELERKQAATLSGAIGKVLLILMVVVLVGGIVLAVINMTTHGGAPHTVTPHTVSTARQVVETITRTLPRG